MKKKLLIAVLCISLLGITGCGNKKETSDNSLNIAYFDNITHGQALVMKSQKTLEKSLGDDVKVTWTSFNAGPAEIEACFSGDIDIGYVGPVPAVTANIKSYGDFVIISGATNGGAVLIARKGVEIESAKDLAGRTVAIPQLGNTQHLLLLDLLSKEGLMPEADGGDVSVVEAANADVTNLMNSGDIDAALVPEPWGTTISKQTDSKIILDYDQIQDGEEYSTAVVIVNKDYMKEHKDIVRKFLKAHIDATNYIVENTEDACKIMNTQLLEDTQKQLEDDVILSAVSKIQFSSEIAKTSILDYAKISKEQKFISAVPDDTVFDDTLLTEMEK